MIGGFLNLFRKKDVVVRVRCQDGSETTMRLVEKRGPAALGEQWPKSNTSIYMRLILETDVVSEDWILFRRFMQS